MHTDDAGSPGRGYLGGTGLHVCLLVGYVLLLPAGHAQDGEGIGFRTALRLAAPGNVMVRADQR